MILRILCKSIAFCVLIRNIHLGTNIFNNISARDRDLAGGPSLTTARRTSEQFTCTWLQVLCPSSAATVKAAETEQWSRRPGPLTGAEAVDVRRTR